MCFNSLLDGQEDKLELLRSALYHAELMDNFEKAAILRTKIAKRLANPMEGNDTPLI